MRVLLAYPAHQVTLSIAESVQRVIECVDKENAVLQSSMLLLNTEMLTQMVEWT